MSKRMNNWLLLFLIISTPFLLGASKKHTERYYQKLWCEKAKGIMEYVLEDGTRVDCLTKNYAVEIEFAKNWYEAVGQALHYARLSERKPAVVLIIKKKSDWRYYQRLRKVAREKGIKHWYMKANRNL